MVVQELGQGLGGLSATETSKLNGTFAGQQARIVWIPNANISHLPAGIYNPDNPRANFNQNDAIIVHTAFVNKQTLLHGVDALYDQIYSTAPRRQLWQGLTIQLGTSPPKTIR